MQINSAKNPSALYGTNQERLQITPARATQEGARPGKSDKSLIVSIIAV